MNLNTQRKVYSIKNKEILFNGTVASWI